MVSRVRVNGVGSWPTLSHSTAANDIDVCNVCVHMGREELGCPDKVKKYEKMMKKGGAGSVSAHAGARPGSGGASKAG